MSTYWGGDGWPGTLGKPPLPEGRNTCPEVVRWVDEKARDVEQEIRSLRALQGGCASFAAPTSASQEWSVRVRGNFAV
jgi:hypothetical protein